MKLTVEKRKSLDSWLNELKNRIANDLKQGQVVNKVEGSNQKNKLEFYKGWF